MYVPDANVQDENDLTPLHLASFYGWVEMVQVLLDCGATAHSEDKLGRTPLHLVAKGTSRDTGHNGVGVVELLLEHGADSNAQDKRQKTPLHLASYYGNVEIVRVLLGRGAIAGAKDALGLTALHMVSCHTDFEFSGFSVAQLLLEHGADINAEDHDHATPSDFALRHRRPEMASFLLPYGGNDDTKIIQSPTPELDNCDFPNFSLGAVVSTPPVSKSGCLHG
jgi:ankyrin repeat protein